MGSSVSENSPPISSDLQMVIEELIKSQSSTAQLQTLLRRNPQDGVYEPAHALAHNIFQSVSYALSKLKSGDIPHVCWNSATTHHTPPFSGDRKVKNSGVRPKNPAAHDQRGGHKRRRNSGTCTRTIVSATPFDDGYVWRKYGQKEILGTKHPRGYFRCTHKTDQGCQAIKQVQRSETETSMYVVTYMGQHTCSNVLRAPQLILDSSTPREMCLLNFESAMAARKHDNPFSSVKHESNEEKPIDLNQASSSSPSNYFASFDDHDHVSFDSNLPMMSLLERGDVDSSTVFSSTSSHTLDMAINMDSVEFEDVLHFDEGGFLNSL